MSGSLMRVWLAAALVVSVTAVSAQTPPSGAAATSLEAAVAAAADQAQVGSSATLTYANRPIIELRAVVLGRPADQRVESARIAIGRLVEAGIVGPVQTRQVGSVAVIEAAGRPIIAIVPADVDGLAGETPAAVAAAAAARLQTALNEVSELGRPMRLLIGAIQVLLATAGFLAAILLLRRLRQRVRQRVLSKTFSRLHGNKLAEAILQASRILDVVQGIVTFLFWAVGLFLAYWWLTFALRRFPYTRPWGESLRGFLLTHLSSAGSAILEALPGLFTVLLIVLGTRVITRLVRLFFQAIEEGSMTVPWVYPETAHATRQILTYGLWLFAVAMAYPFLPGSNSEAFKGISVFLGVVLSLGSSGIMSQVMSGVTLTYSRALRVGDYVSVGNVEGTVTQLGTFSTKIRTIAREDVTIPNAVILSQTVTNYTRLAASDGVYVPTQVTIGYDTPWRQVHALLLLAAARTEGVRREPAPIVRQAALEDYYVRYTLFFCPERPAERRPIIAAVNANILDAFNEYGVQITSPNYVADPADRKVVPRDQWFEPPAEAPAPTDPAPPRTEG